MKKIKQFFSSLKDKSWLWIILILIILVVLVFTSTQWFHPLLEFIIRSANAIQGLTGLVQLIIWMIISITAIFGFVRRRANENEHGLIDKHTEKKEKPSKLVLLPSRDKNFVDRENELLSVGTALEQYQSIQIRGLGGIGKSALAIEAAYREAGYFPDGVVWLSTLDQPTIEDLLNSIATAFEIGLGQMSIAEKKIAIQKGLSSKRVLLILDNVEDIEPARILLDICGQGVVLITSRPPIVVMNTKLIEISTLSTEDSQELFVSSCGRELTYEEAAVAGELFEKRLEGYPLAIKLAAKQMQVQNITLLALLERTEKHMLDFLHSDYLGSVRGPLLSTYEQLNQANQFLFAILCVFFGRTFSAEAVGYIADRADVTMGLYELVSYSLVNVENDRFSMHPVVKEFACEKLSTKTHHTRMITFFAEYTHRNEKNIPALEVEWANIIGAVEWASNNAQYQAVINIVQSLLTDDAYYGFFAQRGYWNEAIKRINQAIIASRKLDDLKMVAFLNIALGLFHYWFGDYQKSRVAYELAESIYKKQNNLRALIRINWQKGYIEDDEDNYTEANRLYETSLELSLKLNDPKLISTSRELVGVVEYHVGNYELAREHLEKSLEECLKRKDDTGIARAQRRLAAVARKQSEQKDNAQSKLYLDEAEGLLLSCLKIEKGRRSIARAKRQLGMIKQAIGKIDDAKAEFEFSLAQSKSLNNKKDTAAVLYNLGMVEESKGNLDRAKEYYSESLGLGRELGVKMGVALNLRQMGVIASKKGNGVEAKELIGEAVAILGAIHSPYLDETRKLLAELDTAKH